MADRTAYFTAAWMNGAKDAEFQPWEDVLDRIDSDLAASPDANVVLLRELGVA